MKVRRLFLAWRLVDCFKLLANRLNLVAYLEKLRHNLFQTAPGCGRLCIRRWRAVGAAECEHEEPERWNPTSGPH